jgi:hypothetical protein
MSVKVASNRFIVSSLERWSALYQRLNKISDFHKLGRWLVAECESAQALRQFEKLEELSGILSYMPIQEYQLIGQFYQGWHNTRIGQKPRKLFEDIIEKSNTFKSKALIALASLDMQDGDYNSAAKLCTEAILRSRTPTVILHSARSIAILKGMEGFHKQALKDLETIAHFVRYATPIARYQYFLASPYAFAYPEWRETGADIARRGYKSRSLVPIIQTFPRNVLYMPEPSPATDKPVKHGRGRLFSLEKWKEEKMVKEPNDDDEIEDKDVDKMSEQDMVLKLIEMLTTGKGDEKKIRKLLKAGLKIFSEK